MAAGLVARAYARLVELVVACSWGVRRRLGVLCWMVPLAGGLLLAAPTAARASGTPYTQGSVFVATNQAGVQEYGGSGAYLTAMQVSGEQAEGVCFNAAGDLFVPEWDSNGNPMAEFDNQGNLITASYGTGWATNGFPSNSLGWDGIGQCATDSSGDVFVAISYLNSASQVEGALDELAPSGAVVHSWAFPQTAGYGLSYIALGPDQCTMYLGGGFGAILRFDVCTGAQESDFSDGYGGWQMEVEPNGDVLVAQGTNGVAELNPQGQVVKTYPVSSLPGSGCPNGNQCTTLMGLSLDPDNATFWVSDYYYGYVWRVNIASGQVLQTIHEGYSTNAVGVFGASGPAGSPVGGPLSPPESYGGSNASENTKHCQQGSHPVDCATGDFWHTYTDVSIPGRGLPLDLTRTYNSLAAGTNGPFGFGWSSSYTMSLTFPSSGDITVNQENGATVTFEPDGSGGYVAPPRVIASLVKNSDGTYTFTRRAREKFTFSSSGQLLSESDLNGETTTLAYNGSGQLASVTDSAGRQLTFTYGSNGDVSKVTDPAGQTVSYAYDSSGELTSVTDRGGGVTSFGYGSNHLLTSITDPNGGTLQNGYDSQGRVVSQTDPMSRTTKFSYSSGQTTITDPNGNTTVQNYSGGELTSLTKGSGSSSAATWTYAYDPYTAQPTTITDPNGKTWSYSYDGSGNVTKEVDPLGRTTTTSYNSLDEPTQITNPSGETTTYNYNADGDITGISRPVGSQTQTTSFSYGDSTHPGDVTAMSDPNGHAWSYSHDSYGDLGSVTDAAGDKTSYSYNALGERIAMVGARGNQSGANPSNYTTSYGYDPLGDLTSVTDPLGHKTTYAYDANLNLVSITDPDGNKTSYAYDADDELTGVTRADGTKLSYSYDADGNETTFTDGNGNKTSYAYDPLNRLASVTDPLSRKTTYAYDGDGNPTGVTDPQARTTSYGYDGANELTSIGYSDGQTPNVTYAYNSDGARTSMTDGTGTTSYSYDALDRLTSVTNGGGQKLGYGYDLADNVTSITYPNGKTVTRAYDSANRLTSLTDWSGNETSFGYDADSNQTSSTFPSATGNVDSYGYDANNQMTSVGMNQGQNSLASISYNYDPAGLVGGMAQTGLPAFASTSYGYTPLDQFNWQSAGPVSDAYDAAGNVTELAGNSGYTYDTADQLTGSPAGADPDQTSPVATSYGYDQLGERTSATPAGGLATSYGYDQAGRLTKVSPASYQVAVGGGFEFSAALQPNGTVLAWGESATGELGNGTTSSGTDATPAEVHDLAGVTQLSTTWEDSLALKADGSVWAWGGNGNGQLGDGSTTDSGTPVKVTGLPAITSVAASERNGYAVDHSGNVWAWGDNSSGQLAQSGGASSTPVEVSGVSGVSQFAGGDESAIALKSDGTVWTWGYSGYGELGTGSSASQSDTPVQVTALSGITQVAAGRFTDYALKSDGTVWAWGYGADGELGNNTTTSDQSTPVQVQGLTNVKQIIAGDGNTAIAVKSDGTVWLWGLNNVGQIGNGTTTNQLTPTQLQGITSPTALGVGYAHALALTTPTSLQAWGWNNDSQLGNGTTTNSETPTQATLYQPTPNPAASSYSYNGDGLLASEHAGNTTTNLAWDQTGSLPLLLSDGTNSYIYGPNGLPAEQIDQNGNITYLHHDQLGSTRLLTNNNGTNVGTFTYNPYGTLNLSTGTATTPLGYAGQYTDPQTGLIYMRARYYDPQTAQLLTRDPAEMLTREPYAYAQDNPLNETDPSGLGCGLFDPGGCINDAVNAAGGFVSRHASTIAFGAGVVGLLVPGVDVLDLGALGEMSINGALSAGATATSIGAGGIASAQDFSGGHYVSGILDAVGSIGGAGALYFDRLANADRLAAGEAWRSGTVQRWLLQDAAANASRARLTSVGAFGLGAIPNVLSLISGAPAWAATLCG